jgi:hypothetical protein
MDGIQFDTVAKMFATTPLTRGRALRSMAAGVAALVGVRLSAEPGTAKKKEKKIQLCVCASADVTTCQTKNKPKSKAKKILQNKPCSYTGRCRLGVSGCIGCAPANNTQQGTCLAGQLCNAGATCVAGCTGTNGTQGSCPGGQLCMIASGQTTGQCQNTTLGCSPANSTPGSCLSGQSCNANSNCIPAGCLNTANPQCPTNQFCCPVGSASGGQCRGTLQAC